MARGLQEGRVGERFIRPVVSIPTTLNSWPKRVTGLSDLAGDSCGRSKRSPASASRPQALPVCCRSVPSPGTRGRRLRRGAGTGQGCAAPGLLYAALALRGLMVSRARLTQQTEKG